MMLERQKEGIAKAKAERRYLGRKPTARLEADLARRLLAEGKTPTEIAKALGIGRGSVYRAIQATVPANADERPAIYCLHLPRMPHCEVHHFLDAAA
ncbi:MAG: Resolvase domain protein [Xanthobacteraceae bacterium]|jgi:DNA invertase Pin-like site-specific DNA recombinase|nr:Resolvase domain protein [Xanthobacteraceae bacterium]